ncbi:MAG: NAD-dependent epimerase/dehydratase family protein [Candidatus Thorarchaeota archaeon]|nr:NAD-dependent epimerase/dehydratase family protein [Candidatus Thorarchaeota archaeon]
MRVLVTGASGFIGRRLLGRLVEEGHEVYAFVRRTSNTQNFPDGVEIREGDLLDAPSMEAAVKDMEAVLHLAAYFDFYPSDVDLLYKVNVDGTRNLMNACIGTSVERFIYCSTTETIGPVRYPPGNEDTELRPQFDYGQSKVMAEKIVREISRDTGLTHIILRPTGVTGEGDLYTGYELIKAINDGAIPILPGSGERHIMYTYVGDVVNGFAMALTSKSAGNNTLILCPDEPMKYKDLIPFIADTLGVEPPKRRVPVSVAKLGIALMSPFKNRGRTTFLWHTKTIESMDQDRWYTNEKAKRLLGWSPELSMQEAIRRAITWYKENDYL